MAIYGTTILAWLALPLMTGAVVLPLQVGGVVYAVLAAVILGFTLVSLFAKTDVDGTCDSEPRNQKSSIHARPGHDL
jgi:hypothetical protein